MNKPQATIRIHSLSDTSKMPGKSWGISTRECQTGSVMARLEGTVCADCYAMKGNYTRFKSAAIAHDARLEKYNENPIDWRDAMIHLLTGEQFFRWFDSGDLQSLNMLEDIVDVAKGTPGCKHWLATREVGYVAEYLHDGNTWPSNMVVRLSAMKYDAPIRNHLTRWSSMVHTTEDAATTHQAHVCPAPKQGGKCGTCRACWDADVPLVSYRKH